jgi:O-methyltransferase
VPGRGPALASPRVSRRHLPGYFLRRAATWSDGRLGVRELPGDLDPEFLALYHRCRPYTMTSVERMFGLYKAVEHVARAEVPGDLVECGVWRGGSSMLAALALERFEPGSQRALYLYDTFAGMSEPTAEDGADTHARWRAQQDGDVNAWCYAPLDEVRRNLAAAGVEGDRLKLVEGKVEDTIPGVAPERIALLRLDTDWYESTLHELRHLYDRVPSGGILLLDDYGRWQGARRAVDEFFAGGPPILLNRLDSTGRIGVRP